MHCIHLLYTCQAVSSSSHLFVLLDICYSLFKLFVLLVIFNLIDTRNTPIYTGEIICSNDIDAIVRISPVACLDCIYRCMMTTVDRLWRKVRANTADFNSWVALLDAVEKQVCKSSSFLRLFPLFVPYEFPYILVDQHRCVPQSF